MFAYQQRFLLGRSGLWSGCLHHPCVASSQCSSILLSPSCFSRLPGRILVCFSLLERSSRRSGLSPSGALPTNVAMSNEGAPTSGVSLAPMAFGSEEPLPMTALLGNFAHRAQNELFEVSAQTDHHTLDARSDKERVIDF